MQLEVYHLQFRLGKYSREACQPERWIVLGKEVCAVSLSTKSVLFLNKAIFVFMKSSFLNLVCQKHVHATSPTHAVHLIQAVSEGFVNVLKTFFSTDLLIVLSPQKWDLHVGKNLSLFVEVAD